MDKYDVNVTRRVYDSEERVEMEGVSLMGRQDCVLETRNCLKEP